MRPRVKICCMNSIEEARTAIEAGASAIGLVGPMPSGPGVIDNELIYLIARTVPPPVATFLLTSETTAEGIIRHHVATRTNTIQMVDTVHPGAYQELRKSMPVVKLVQVIHVIDDSSVDEAIRVAEYVDAILLDSGNPMLEVKELGGTGRVHDWRLSRKIRKSIPIPVFLAGGLNPRNVRQAMDEVSPYGIDVCSGVRTNGRLDKDKLEAFFSEVYR